jgi:SOS-response transcriptional repressor LexA
MAKQKMARAHWSRAIAGLMASHITLRTQTALAKASGVAQSTIGRILRGEVDPQSDNVERLARAFGLTYSALAALAEEHAAGGVPTRSGPSQRGQRAVPLLGWVPATGAAVGVAAHDPADVTDWIGCPRPPRGLRTVAFKVAGDSMAPDYPHGCILYVDPDVAAVQGQDVVVFLADRHEVVFRRLAVERRRRYLRAIHPLVSHEVIPLSIEARILGVVVGRYVDVVG